jgi:Asp-tRNA(Asn)/Glu-tRNA(Gln) amidotransferase A subunit family amidase
MTLRIDRRTFVLSSLALARPALAQGVPETFREWLDASKATRAAALAPLLDRIRTLDREIHAWVQVQPLKPTGSGALDDIPFGVKDIIETEGLVTEFGSPVYKGRVSRADAAIVRELRMRGGVVVGKTHTAAFAFRHPPPTRNPRNLEHTPGGSSSGSAAAVAAGMVPLAIGTQTGGSVIRPASFCGICGFKPTHGWFPTDGVLEYAKSHDTLGFFTHTAADMLAFWGAFGRPTGEAARVPFAAQDPLPDVDREMAAAFTNAIARLKNAGHSLRPVDIAPMLATLRTAGQTIATYEGARAHRDRFEQYGDRLDEVAQMVRDGLKISDSAYEAAKQRVAEGRSTIGALCKDTPVILSPAAPGPAPRGLTTTGDSRINYPWSTMGTPAITIPMGEANGLPMGIQLAGNLGDEARVLRAAVAVEQSLGFRLSALPRRA